MQKYSSFSLPFTRYNYLFEVHVPNDVREGQEGVIKVYEGRPRRRPRLIMEREFPLSSRPYVNEHQGVCLEPRDQVTLNRTTGDIIQNMKKYY